MIKRLITTIAILTLSSSLLFASGCTPVTPPIAEAIPSQGQDTSAADPLASNPEDQDAAAQQTLEPLPQNNDPYDQLNIMAEKQIIFRSGGAKYAPGFPLSNLSDLESRATAIVKARAISAEPNPDLEERIEITMTTIRIDEVIVSDGSLIKGDEKILVEYYRISDDPTDENNIIVWSSNGSMPMKKDQQYLLFLRKSTNGFGDYAVTAVWQGKYPITEKTLTDKAADIAPKDLEIDEQYSGYYLPIAQQVFDKYLR